MEESLRWIPSPSGFRSSGPALIGIAVALYVILDGFDLGIGILFPLEPRENCRDVMMNSVAPFWDGNETWLILGGGGLFVAFPLAYAVIMPGLYLPIIIMLLALVFRGVAFEFRWAAKPLHVFWDNAFAWGSIVATFMQGVVLGGFLQGIVVENKAFAGGPLDWLAPFPLFTGVALRRRLRASGQHLARHEDRRRDRRERRAAGPSGSCLRWSCSWPSSACGRRSPSSASPSAGSRGRTCCICRRCRC